ncbi:DNA polymerase IV [Sorlinia euscelidii]
MDAFYASVEQRDQPELRGQPLAVGRAEGRGVVAAASYEARAYGVRSAMPSIVARRKCPHLVFVPPRFPVYHAVSAQIHEIFRRYTAIIQPLSLDEAYLDVTEAASKYGSATAIAEAIREDIRRETGLTASAGVSYNRFLAKLASDCRKPDGLYVITPAQGPDFVARLPVSQFHGIGPATARRMEALGIHTGNDLRQVSRDMLRAHFGKVADFYYNIARAIDDRPVDPHRVRKSIGSETTYAHDLHDLPSAQEALADVADRVWKAYIEKNLHARTITLKIKFADFRMITRATSFKEFVSEKAIMWEAALHLLQSEAPFRMGIRLLGLTLSSFSEAEAAHNPQMTLFCPRSRQPRYHGAIIAFSFVPASGTSPP